ncbi:MAG: glycosyltransferase family 4 protein [Phycisphaerae bacterium]
MKIGIATTAVPFVYGGAEVLAENLRDALTSRGHQAEIIRIPFDWNPPNRIVEHILACRMLSVSTVDHLIGLKFPAYHIPHPSKTLWLLHQHRQAYDLWGTAYHDIPDTPEGRAIRLAIITSDNTFLKEARRICTISRNVGDRLFRYNAIKSEALYPPLMHPEKYQCGDYGDYLFFPSRINSSKRQLLAVQAMAFTRSPVRLVLAGAPDSAEDVRQVRQAVEQHGDGRVTLMDRWISEEEKLKLFAGSLGTLYVPYDEDYGYISLESFHSRKAIITCADSGGSLEFVDNGYTGLVALPEPRAIAEAMDKLHGDKVRARRLGEAGFNRLASMKISWDRVIERLTQ